MLANGISRLSLGGPADRTSMSLRGTCANGANLSAIEIRPDLSDKLTDRFVVTPIGPVANVQRLFLLPIWSLYVLVQTTRVY